MIKILAMSPLYLILAAGILFLILYLLETRKNRRLAHENTTLSQAVIRHEERLANAGQQHAELSQVREQFNKDFELIAARILEEKTQKFTETNRSNLDLLLSPLKDNIRSFEEKVEKVYKAESDERNMLKGEISKLMELNKQISEEAGNLARALKSDTKKQGNWGEIVLERILEASGLKEGESYLRQSSFASAGGGKSQPDIVVMLPDKKHVIIDSKVSLVAYERLVNCETEEDRQLHLKDHLLSVRQHVSGLGSRDYQNLADISSPDFVLLFLPIESSFAIAVQNDVDLFEYAWNRKVVIVTPSTLLATLRTIASLWKQEQQTRNALEIATRAGALYDKFAGFVQDMKGIGNSLDASKKHFASAMNKLSEGDGNLMNRVETLEKLGARVKKQLDKKMIEE